MTKRMFSLLLALCMLVGLLPAVAIPHVHAEAGGALETAYTLKMAGYGTASDDVRALTLTNYDTPIYTKNTTRTNGRFRVDGVDYYADYITQSTSDAGEDDWNAKLIWHSGDEGPTLYLDGFVTDNYNEEYGTFRYRTEKYFHFHAGILTDSTAPLKIVLQGEDSSIQAYGGIQYQNKLTIESVGDTKLSMYVKKGGIMPRDSISAYEGTSGGNAVAAGDLILNANLEIQNISGALNSGGIVTSMSGNIIFNGGNVTLSAPSSGTYALRTLTAGDVIVNGGNITAKGGYRGVRTATTNHKVYVYGGFIYIYGSYSAVYAGGDGASNKSYPVVAEDACCTIKVNSAQTIVATSRVTTHIRIQFHTPTEHPATEPQVGVEGNTLYYSCSTCNKYFSDKWGAKEIEEGSWVLAPLPEGDTCEHTFDDANDGTCNNCAYTRPVAADLTMDENNKLVFADAEKKNLYHRAVVYYLGDKTVSDITLTNPLLAIDPTAKTYWGIEEINGVQLLKGGNYVVHLFYNTADSAKVKIAKQFTVDTAMPTMELVGGFKLNVTAGADVIGNYRVTAYYLGGNTNVDIYDEAALKAIDPTAKTYWGLGQANNVQFLQNGKYVVYLSYNIGKSAKQSIVAEFEINMGKPSVWLEENGQIGTVIPSDVAHRNYVIYYLGDKTVDDIYDIDALKAIDADPICFDNQKQIAERGVLTEKGNYVLVLYYNYAGGHRQYISVFETLA